MTTLASPAAPERLTMGEAFLFWLKRGFISFGLIGMAAAIALFRFKAGVIPVVQASGMVGLALRLTNLT